jgi:DNA-directed RNA polymerase subunit F
MKNNIKKLRLIEHGFKTNTIMSLSDGQIDALYNRLVERKKIESNEAELVIDPNNPKDLEIAKQKGVISPDGKMKFNVGEQDNIDDKDALGDLAMQTSTGQETPHDEKDMAPDGMDDDSDTNRDMMTDGTIKEKFESKSQQKYFFARCNDKSLSKKERNKWCKMADEFAADTKNFSKLPEKKKKTETKENYLDMIGKAMNKNMSNKIADIRPSLKFEEVVQSEMERIVEKYIQPTITKKDFLNLVDDSKLTTEQGPGIAPAKPKVDPGTKPKKPGTPYRPKPGPKPAPKAKKQNLPDWLTFDKLNIEFKK